MILISFLSIPGFSGRSLIYVPRVSSSTANTGKERARTVKRQNITCPENFFKYIWFTP
jgi:hypothetical protein